MNGYDTAIIISGKVTGVKEANSRGKERRWKTRLGIKRPQLFSGVNTISWDKIIHSKAKLDSDAIVAIKVRVKNEVFEQSMTFTVGETPPTTTTSTSTTTTTTTTTTISPPPPQLQLQLLLPRQPQQRQPHFLVAVAAVAVLLLLYQQLH